MAKTFGIEYQLTEFLPSGTCLVGGLTGREMSDKFAELARICFPDEDEEAMVWQMRGILDFKGVWRTFRPGGGRRWWEAIALRGREKIMEETMEATEALVWSTAAPQFDYAVDTRYAYRRPHGTTDTLSAHLDLKKVFKWMPCQALSCRLLEVDTLWHRSPADRYAYAVDAFQAYRNLENSNVYEQLDLRSAEGWEDTVAPTATGTCKRDASDTPGTLAWQEGFHSFVPQGEAPLFDYALEGQYAYRRPTETIEGPSARLEIKTVEEWQECDPFQILHLTKHTPAERWGNADDAHLYVLNGAELFRYTYPGGRTHFLDLRAVGGWEDITTAEDIIAVEPPFRMVFSRDSFPKSATGVRFLKGWGGPFKNMGYLKDVFFLSEKDYERGYLSVGIKDGKPYRLEG